MASNSTPETAPGPAAGTAAPPESDKTAAEAPASSAERAIIKVGEHSFRTREDIAAYVSSLPPAEQYTAQTAIRDNLLQHHSGIEDLIFDFYSYTESSKAYEKANISREAFLEDNERLIEEVRTITAKRDVRKESLKRLNKYLTTPRGLALLSTILADMSISGKNFIADLATIFSKVPAEEGVGHLNAAILERNRRPKTKGMRPRAGIMPADAARAKGRITQGEQWAEEDVALDELKSMRLRYGASGLLEEGSAAVAARPHFEGEGEGRRSGAGPSQQVGEGVSVTGSTVSRSAIALMRPDGANRTIRLLQAARAVLPAQLSRPRRARASRRRQILPNRVKGPRLIRSEVSRRSVRSARRVQAIKEGPITNARSTNAMPTNMRLTNRLDRMARLLLLSTP
jgi:hypothetical protein